MDSELKDIKNFEGLYAVTKSGQVWSYPRSSNYRGRKVKGGWLNLRGSGRKYLKVLSDEPRGYKTVGLMKEGKSFYFYVHRLVAQAFIPNPKNKKMVNHINGDQSDNRVENLEWVTREENTRHAFENGLTTRGKRNSQTILTEDQVKEIRKKYIPQVVSMSKLAKQYEVSQAAISLILTRKNWAWLK